MNIKLAFFDIDGTLSAPVYENENGNLVIGFPLKEWEAYTDLHQEHTYDLCRPVPFVKEYAQKLKNSGTRLFALSTSMFPGETKAKHAFMEKHYDGLFEEVITVMSDAEKIEVIERYADQAGAGLSECMMVEDTLAILFQTQVKGIRSVHVANIAVGVPE